MNLRPPGYELRSISPSAGAQHFSAIFETEMDKTRRSCSLRSTAVLRKMGQRLGQTGDHKIEGAEKVMKTEENHRFSAEKR